jgi:hypothetical protein
MAGQGSLCTDFVACKLGHWSAQLRPAVDQPAPPFQWARRKFSPPGLRRPGTETDLSPPYCHSVILHGVVIKQRNFSFSFAKANDV